MSIKNVVTAIPVYNEEKTLPVFLTRLMAVRKDFLESNPQGEFVIGFVDDGSTDRTLKIISRWKKTDSADLMHVVYHNQNQGLAASIIDGYQAALGIIQDKDWLEEETIVCRLDADLEHNPEMILKYMDKFAKGYKGIVAQIEYTEDIIGDFDLSFHQFFGKWEGKVILDVYLKQHSPGFQMYLARVVRQIMGEIPNYREVYEKLYGEKMIWGLDLAILAIASVLTKKKIFLCSAGKSNQYQRRTLKKVEAQMLWGFRQIQTFRLWKETFRRQ